MYITCTQLFYSFFTVNFYSHYVHVYNYWLVFVEGKESFDKSKQFRIRIPFDVEETDGAGWELYKGKFACKKIDLSSSMDTKHLAAHAVDLNLKLMKWRLQPNIDLERLQSLKVLLLGSGFGAVNLG